MMRNDYRRSLILLRSNASGYSGHVRLERRTLMGTMYFLVQSPGDCPALRAALVGRGRDGACYACALGELQQDARGQAVLSYSFDPRDICRKELEQYQLIAVTCAGDASCQVVLFGNVCGHAELNWEAVRGALCELYAGEQAGEIPSAQAEIAPATELPEARPDANANADAPSPASEAAAPEGEGDAAQRIAQAEAAGEVAPGSAGDQPGEPGETYQPRATQANFGDAPQGEAGGTAEQGGAAMYGAGAEGAAGQGSAVAYEAEALVSGAPEGATDAAGADSSAGAATLPNSAQSGAASGEALACDLLEAQGVHSSAPWPEPAEALRALFQTEPALTDAPDDQCVYVEAPMPEGSGFPFVAAGLLILGGALAAIRYALPATWSEEPPAGLEDCTWIGDQNKGWWLTEVPVGGADSHMLPR